MELSVASFRILFRFKKGSKILLAYDTEKKIQNLWFQHVSKSQCLMSLQKNCYKQDLFYFRIQYLLNQIVTESGD